MIMANEQIANHVCRFCKGSFTQPQHLYKHVQQVHAASPSTKNNRTCPICGTVFLKYNSYRTHLRHLHGQKNEGQIIAFKCFNDFFLWKTELERRSCCKFSLHSAPKLLLPSNERIHVYQCDKSVIPSNRKKASSAVIKETCSAMICATESLKNQETRVEYWNTHTGHSVKVEDELNAAINNLPCEEPTTQVIEMLNNIGQNVETGPDFFIETVEEEVTENESRRLNKVKIFGKAKKSTASSPKSTPIVQNFSFKKDPSKKKESSIYSLASVACGKVSANKSILKSQGEISESLLVIPVTKDLDKFIKDTPLSKPAKERVVTSVNTSVASSTLSTKSNVYHDTSLGGRFIAINPLPSGMNKEDIVLTRPSVDSLATNRSLSSKVVSPAASKTAKSPMQENLKTYSKKNVSSVENIIDSTNVGKSALNITKDTKITNPIGTSITGLTLQPGLSTTATSPYLTNSGLTMQPVTSVLPGSPAFISINNKLIPIMNSPGTILPTNVNSNFLLPSVFPQPLVAQLPQSSLLNTTAVTSSSSAPSFSLAGKGTPAVGGTILPIGGSPLVLIPYSSNSSPSSVTLTKPPGLIVSSPLVSNGIRPIVSATANTITPISVSSTFIAPNISKTVTSSTKLTQMPTIINNGKTISATSFLTTGRNLISTTVSNTVKAQKVSFPVASTSSNKLSGDKNSILALSQQSKVNTVVLNTMPISSTPAINIPSFVPTSVNQNTTQYVMDASGDLYMLEPLDDDIGKNDDTPVTSTPKKNDSVALKTPSPLLRNMSPIKKRKRSSLKTPITPEIVPPKPKKIKSDKDESSKKSVIPPLSSISTTSAPSTVLPNKETNESSDSSSDESETSSLPQENKTVTSSSDGKMTKFTEVITTTSACKTEMVITIAKSKTSPVKKEVSFITKTPLSEAIKSAASFFTTKTVPSYSIPQSRPIVTSLISSTLSLSSHSETKSSLTEAKCLPIEATSVGSYTPNFNPLSSPKIATSSVPGLSSSLSTLRQSPTFSGQENPEVPELHEVEAGNSRDIKRGVTIKSVAQDKRCVNDDDLEIMKKVKYYKLEMKYFACQEQCKLLKIELAKALAKNKELMLNIEEKLKNENSNKVSVKGNDKDSEGIKTAIDEKVTSQEEALENESSTAMRIVSSNENSNPEDIEHNEPEDTTVVVKDVSEPINVTLESKEIVMKDLEKDAPAIPSIENEENADLEKKDSDEVEKDGDEEEKDSDEVEKDCDEEEKDSDEEVKDSDEEVKDSGEEVKDVAVSQDTQDKIADIDKDSSIHSNDQIDKTEVSDKPEKMEIDKTLDSKETVDSSTSNVDVYTMVRTSVLRKLYADLYDLSEENKLLLQNLENAGDLQSDVPSTEIFEASIV